MGGKASGEQGWTTYPSMVHSPSLFLTTFPVSVDIFSGGFGAGSEKKEVRRFSSLEIICRGFMEVLVVDVRLVFIQRNDQGKVRCSRSFLCSSLSGGKTWKRTQCHAF